MASGTAFFEWQGDIDGLSVVDGAFVLVTAEGSDHPKYNAVAALLRRIRRGLGIDVVFVSLFIDGQPQVRYPELDEEGDCDPLEAAFARQVLGCSETLVLPVLGREGWVYGTVCCEVHSSDSAWGDRSQVQALESVAGLLATTLDEALAPLTSEYGSLAPSSIHAGQQAALA
ncbi:MAG: hypothetical protein HY854_17225 [Burkholderiales bacterium]|nr:hypothetical protein [Burkholderiales bacterium]